MERRFRSILVLGGGITGLSAGIAFARYLPRARITIVETPPDPAALADRLPFTLPSTGLFHQWIGLDEGELVRAGAATHRLGTRFSHWSADGGPWLHVHGAHGLAAGNVPFHQLWLRARRAGGALPFSSYCVAAALAEAGRFVHPDWDPASPLSTFDYALRLDPERYRAILSAFADRLRANRVRGGLAGTGRREDGRLAYVLLDGGRRLEADLFVDCAGPAAPLLSAVGGTFEDWGDTLAGDRMLLASRPGAGAPSLLDEAEAMPLGWRWTAPLADRLVQGFVHDSAVGGEEEARQALGAEEAETIALRPGRRPEPWIGNVLALGDAAVAVDPLAGTNLHLAQRAILRALELLPGRDCDPLELREYVRRTGQETSRIRDFLALHTLHGPTRLGRFWAEAAARRTPPTLAHSLGQFARRGRLPFYEEESFQRDSWLAVLFGLGLAPDAIHPAATSVDPEEAEQAMARLHERLAAIPPLLPSYPDYLAASFKRN